MLNYKITTPPAKEPVSLEEAKKQCRFLSSKEDTLIKGLIVAAREYAEGVLGEALVTRGVTAVANCFPGKSSLALPVGPLKQVDSLKYTDNEGIETEFTDFSPDSFSTPNKLVLNPGKSWPAATLHPVNPIKIVYQAGYGDPENVPQTVKQAILLIVAHWFANREETVTGAQSFSVPMAAESLLMQKRHTNT